MGARRWRVAGISAGLVFLAALPATAQVTGEAPARLASVDLPAELDRVLRDYERAWEAGDAEGLSRLFTGDGFIGSGGGWIRGRDGIADEYRRAGGALRLRAIAYAVDGDVGYVVGAYGYVPTSEDVDSGKFVLALRRGSDGRWLIAADLDNANRRPAGGPGT